MSTLDLILDDILGARGGRGVAQKNLDLIEHSRRILEDIQPCTSRGVAYQLFTQKLIPGMFKKHVANVARLLVVAREKEMIPWEWIVDETRGVESVATYKNVAEFGESMARIRKDLWQHQPAWLMVMLEKSTVSGVIRPILERYAVDFLVMHGFGSATALHDLAETSRYCGGGRTLEILYIGDFDPSGMHMSEIDLPKRLEKYDGVATVTRIALTKDDCTAGLPSFPLESKISDARHDWFKQSFGSTCWELDAMNPNVLRERLESEILARIDLEAWQHCRVTETAERESYNRYLRAWPGIFDPGQKCDPEREP